MSDITLILTQQILEEKKLNSERGKLNSGGGNSGWEWKTPGGE